jgi:hypothetical protein
VVILQTQIFITPPGGNEEEIKAYDSCQTTMSITDKAGSFSLTIPSFSTDIFDKYPVGSDVRIIQNDNVFRGWVLNPARKRNGSLSSVEISGLSYTARLQRILVTENYSNQKVSDIVLDLLQKYAPKFNQDSIVTCHKVISIKFNDVFLFDAMEQLASIAGYEWYIDEPVPKQINTQPQGSGWHELIETIIHKISYPSESLYPAIDLYPS